MLLSGQNCLRAILGDARSPAKVISKVSSDGGQKILTFGLGIPYHMIVLRTVPRNAY
jgi:hypothetical protein